MAALGAIGRKNQDSAGPLPSAGGYFRGGIPAPLIPVIVANFGQAGGGVSIFGG